MMQKHIHTILVFLCFGIIFCIAPQSTSAAELLLQSTNTIPPQADTATFSLKVTSLKVPMNAVLGTLHFDPSQLEVVSISTEHSIVRFWPVEPTFSNTQGTVSFESVVVNPTHQSNGGVLFDTVFRLKKVASTTISISEASILANDGNASELLEKTSGVSLMRSAEGSILSRKKDISPVVIKDYSAPIPSQSQWNLGMYVYLIILLGLSGFVGLILLHKRIK